MRGGVERRGHTTARNRHLVASMRHRGDVPSDRRLDHRLLPREDCRVPISIDADELRQILRATPPEQNVMLVGRHGIGKSELIRGYFAERGMEVVAFFLGQMSDPGDLIGLLHKNEQTGRSEFLPPAWWPADEQPVVLFLDELNRGRPEVLQSVMELTLSKTLAGKRLPTGSVIVAAVNDGDEYQLTDLDPALVSRFNVYRFEPTVDQWLQYARRTRHDRRIIDFIEDQPHWLDGEPTVASERRGDIAIEKSPDRRGWSRVAEAVIDRDIGAFELKLIAGIVGSHAAVALRDHLAARLPISTDQIFGGDEEAIEQLGNLSVQQTARLNQRIVRAIERRDFGGHEEMAAVGLHRYLSRLIQIQRRESLAHFASLIQQGDPSVLDWTSGSIQLTTLLIEFFDDIAAATTSSTSPPTTPTTPTTPSTS